MEITLSKETLEKIAGYFQDLQSSRAIERLEESRSFENEILAVLLTNARRFTDNIPISFFHMPDIHEYAATPKNNSLHQNPIFLDQIISSIKDYISRTGYPGPEFKGQIRSFANNMYESIHSVLTAQVKKTREMKISSDAESKEIIKSLYGWHINPSLAAGDIMLKHMQKSRITKDEIFQQDLHSYHSLFDTAYRTLEKRHPYASIEKLITKSCLISGDFEDHLKSHSSYSQDRLLRAIIVNLYAASQLLGYITHSQIMQQSNIYQKSPSSGKRPDSNPEQLALTLQDALKKVKIKGQ